MEATQLQGTKNTAQVTGRQCASTKTEVNNQYDNMIAGGLCKKSNNIQRPEMLCWSELNDLEHNAQSGIKTRQFGNLNPTPQMSCMT